MGTIQQLWNEAQSPVEDGIFFANDEWVALSGSPDAGYSVGTRQPIAGMIGSDTSCRCDLIEKTLAREQSGNYALHAGETSWEGEGYIAVVTVANGKLLWLLHLSTSESFVEVALDGGVIRAVSDVYPIRHEWSIPIHAPERFTVETSRAAS